MRIVARSIDAIGAGKAGLREYRPRDKVMQLRNDYEKDVFNGDSGTGLHADRGKFRLFVDFDGRTVSYEKDEMNDITLAYAVSVHKAQGSEFPGVLLVLTTHHYLLLQRNLLYTALTRGRRLVVLLGTRQALAMAIKNDQPVRRFTDLAAKLRQGCRRMGIGEK